MIRNANISFPQATSQSPPSFKGFIRQFEENRESSSFGWCDAGDLDFFSSYGKKLNYIMENNPAQVSQKFDISITNDKYNDRVLKVTDLDMNPKGSNEDINNMLRVNEWYWPTYHKDLFPTEKPYKKMDWSVHISTLKEYIIHSPEYSDDFKNFASALKKYCKLTGKDEEKVIPQCLKKLLEEPA